MKTSFITFLGLAASTVASPLLGLDFSNLVGGTSGSTSQGARVFNFDYRVNVHAIPNEVVDSEGNPSPGLKGSSALYRLGFNSENNVVCYNITHFNWRGQYESPANTATHLHEAPKGSPGPPRLAFPNPKGPNRERNAVGCMKGPFRTGLIDTTTGKDTGAGFHVQQIIDRPRAFFVDAHSSLAVPGAFRGQLPRKNT